MKTQALKQALDHYGFTATFGGGRRDEEKSRAKERVFSLRNAQHAWDPKNQRPDEKTEWKNVRFRTLGCYPLTGGVESDADTLDAIIEETLQAITSERTSRVIDHEAAGSMERRKREGVRRR